MEIGEAVKALHIDDFDNLFLMYSNERRVDKLSPNFQQLDMVTENFHWSDKAIQMKRTNFDVFMEHHINLNERLSQNVSVVHNPQFRSAKSARLLNLGK